jgi:hypothetical protein
MKTHLTYILLLLLISLVAIYYFDQNRKNKAESDRKDSVIAEKNAEIKYHVSETGRIIAQKQAAEATAKEALEVYPEIVSQIRKEFDVKTKDLKAFVHASFQAQGQGDGSVTINNYYDSTSRKSYSKIDFNTDDNPYLKLSTTIDTKLYDSLKRQYRPAYTYAYSDSILMAFHAKKKWKPFGKEQVFASARLSNPDAMVTNSTSVLISEAKDKRWSVSLSGGWGLVKVGSEVHTGWFAGPSVSYSLFKF